MNLKFVMSIFAVILIIISCSKDTEYSESEAQALKDSSKTVILSKTVKKFGGQKFEIGKVGGTWNASINNDPKTFNTLTARDGDSYAVVTNLFDSLSDYDPYKREWKPNLAAFEIKIDEKNDKMKIIHKLRDDLYWTTSDGKVKEKATSDDVIFWYNEIEGDKSLQQPGYNSQYIEMKDGKTARIEIEKIDELTFSFNFPRIVANPILYTNMDFGPRYVYEKAKKEGGVDALLKVFSIDTDVKKIPSIGQYHIVEYTPGVQVKLERNPYYWKKDEQGTSLPYIKTVIYKIVPDINTQYLLFKEGKLDSYSVRPEDLDELINKEKTDYTIYNGGAALGSRFITFNQNPKTMDKKVYNWFKETKFRQAISCTVNRKRIIEQVFRGLAEPALYFFAKPNMYFDEKIKQKFLYDPAKAVKLLSEIGIKKDKDGFMIDKEGNKIEFEINMGVENNMGIDICNIISDELKNIGINAKVKPIDFQKLVDMLTHTYDWQVVMLGGHTIFFPSQFSNIWPSKGNFHYWYPLQEKPATEWEAKIDKLYNDGLFTIDNKKAKNIYDEYQQIILDQNPLIYIAYPNSFFAARNKWGNIFYDTLGGTDMRYVYLKE